MQSVEKLLPMARIFKVFTSVGWVVVSSPHMGGSVTGSVSDVAAPGVSVAFVAGLVTSGALPGEHAASAAVSISAASAMAITLF